MPAATSRWVRATMFAILVAVFAAARPSLADNINPNNDGSKFAWGENVGWFDAQPLGPAGPGILVGDFLLTGWMWSENLGWVSLSCDNTSSCAAVSYGVANDGFGRLSGFAWSENAGWIDFAPASTQVVIDPATGTFAGSAWGENVGWITFSSAAPVPYRVQTSWCQGTASPPAGMPALSLTVPAGTTQLTWSSLSGAAWYDVASGDLGTLASSGGNFTTSTTSCVSRHLTATTTSSPPTPPAGKGFWYVVRGADCKGNGTYDEGGAQIGLRDAEIEASTFGCR